MLFCFSCSSEKAKPQTEEQQEQESQESQTQKEEPTSEESVSGDIETESESTEESTPSSDATSSESAPDSGDKQRDCEKISWGDGMKEGDVIARGDVEGFVDSDKDGVVEQQPTDAGMCQFHLTGKKCGLVLYSRRT